MGGCEHLSIHLEATQGKPHIEVPLLFKTATYQSGMVCLFPPSLSALHVWGVVSDLTQDAPKWFVNQHIV